MYMAVLLLHVDGHERVQKQTISRRALMSIPLPWQSLQLLVTTISRALSRFAPRTLPTSVVATIFPSPSAAIRTLNQSIRSGLRAQ